MDTVMHAQSCYAWTQSCMQSRAIVDTVMYAKSCYRGHRNANAEKSRAHEMQKSRAHEMQMSRAYKVEKSRAYFLTTPGMCE